MSSLLISVAMLGIAPLLYKIAQQFQVFWSYAHRILVVSVSSLVVLHLLPESIRFAGWIAVLWAFVGLYLPSLLERLWSKQAHAVHLTSLLIALGGLAVHGMMDGAALANIPLGLAGSGSSALLKLAVMLHRLPAALLIWSLFYPKHGAKVPSAILSALGLATILGFFMGNWILEQVHDVRIFFHFQALVSGSLLHLAFDRHEDH